MSLDYFLFPLGTQMLVGREPKNVIIHNTGIISLASVREQLLLKNKRLQTVPFTENIKAGLGDISVIGQLLLRILYWVDIKMRSLSYLSYFSKTSVRLKGENTINCFRRDVIVSN